jgi:hypothetical protein
MSEWVTTYTVMSYNRMNRYTAHGWHDALAMATRYARRGGCQSRIVSDRTGAAWSVHPSGEAVMSRRGVNDGTAMTLAQWDSWEAGIYA